MGDRYTWYEDCPKCGGKETVEVYDAPSCYMFSRSCGTCNWSDGLNYYETEPNTIELLTEEEAKKRELVWQSGLESAISKNPDLVDKVTIMHMDELKDLLEEKEK